MSLSYRRVEELLEGPMVVGYYRPADLLITNIAFFKHLKVFVNLLVLLDLSLKLLLESLTD